MRRSSTIILSLAATFSVSCTQPPATSSPRPQWAVAIHGGAGVLDPAKYGDRAPDYADGLRRALNVAVTSLKSGEASINVVEQVVATLEDDPLFNAGRGAVLNWDGEVEMDASIMSGGDHSCGAVAGVRTVKNPIRLARLVMDRSRHVLFAGAGAEAFADQMAMPRMEPSYFHTQRRHESWLRYREKHESPDQHGTVGCVALDRQGRLAAATSTGGLTGKQPGRVGDTPIIGAGTWADDETCAVSCTGTGEEFIRHGVAQRISDLMANRGASLNEAARHVIENILRPGDGGIIAVDRSGAIAMVYSTGGMFRGAATSDGRFEVAIWDEPENPRQAP